MKKLGKKQNGGPTKTSISAKSTDPYPTAMRKQGQNMKAKGQLIKAAGTIQKEKGQAMKAKGQDMKAKGKALKEKGRVMSVEGKKSSFEKLGDEVFGIPKGQKVVKIMKTGGMVNPNASVSVAKVSKGRPTKSTEPKSATKKATGKTGGISKAPKTAKP